MEAIQERPEAAQPETKREVSLMPTRMQLAEQWRRDFCVNAEEGTLPTDIVNPAYWSHVAAQLQQFDRIDVREETGAWLAELIVIDGGRNYAKVYMAKLHLFHDTDRIAAPAAKHRVEWKGPQRKHSVIRIADNQVLQEGFPDKSAASAWLENYEKTTG
ncbi:MAG TPA: hypothetical protein VIO33_07010, partial [Burkholderiaceae bacterium]